VHAQAGVLHYQSEWTGLPLSHLADNKADMVGAVHGTIALLAALLHARATGEGQHVEVPLFDALLSFYSETPFALLPEPKHRDEAPLFDAGPHGIFVIAGPMRNCWHRMQLAHALVDPVRPEDDAPTKRRLRQRAIEEWMRARPSADAIFAGVEQAGLGAARVETLRDALTGPLARERGLLVEIDDRRGGTRPVVRAPYRFSGESCAVRRPAPRRGEHNAEVLREWLGWADERIRALAELGVLRSDDGKGRIDSDRSG
jgi:CoA:oxalate CoA-transferase